MSAAVSNVARPAGGSKKGSGALLARAERLCRDRNLRLTPMRRRVLQELSLSGEPLTAYDLADLVRDEKRIAPVTVYRALDFLLEAKLVHRIVMRNAFTPCDHAPHHDETPVFLVCAQCGTVKEIHSDRLERDLREAATEAGFEPRRRVIEIEGECAECRAQIPSPSKSVLANSILAKPAAQAKAGHGSGTVARQGNAASNSSKRGRLIHRGRNG
ncbi:MAG: Fur family transcriptional regulator [Hyphomicrobiales bacterium]